MSRLKILLLFISICFLYSICLSQKNYQPYEKYQDIEKWTEYRVGNMPLVITVPHGGYIRPDSIPNRECKDAVTVVDSYTIELVNAIDSVFMVDYGFRPHIIIAYIARIKVDQNRDIVEGTCGNIQVAKPWNVFHDFTDDAIELAVAKFGKTAYIDLHAHGHSIQRLELGYLLTGSELLNLDENANEQRLIQKSSLQNLFRLYPQTSFRELIKGAKAFGTSMYNDKFASVPSQQDPFPNEDEKYFNGGYNTKRYTSSKYPKVFGWQIESNYKGVREPYNRPLFARAFCKNILQYMKDHTDLNIATFGK